MNRTPEEFQIILSKNWHPEKTQWVRIKRSLDDQRESWARIYQLLENRMSSNEVSDKKLIETQQAKNSLRDQLQQWKNNFENVKAENIFITDVEINVDDYFREVTQVFEDAEYKLDTLDEEWENQNNAYQEELAKNLDELSKHLDELRNQFSSLDKKLKDLLEDGVESTFELRHVNLILAGFDRLIQDCHRIQTTTERLEGRTIEEITERKSLLTQEITKTVEMIEQEIEQSKSAVADYVREEQQGRKILSNYNNISVCESEVIVLKELEKLVKKPLPQIQKVDWNAFGFVTDKNGRITGLSLPGMMIDTLPHIVSKLSELTILNLRNNNLTTIPEPIVLLSRLKVLYLEKNKITTIPDNIALIQKTLEELHLYHNNIQSLPKALCQLNNLKYLNLNSNQLKQLPRNIGQLKDLNVLDLHNNKITTLPDSIGSLTKLQRLYISKNSLETEQHQLFDMIRTKGGLVN